MPFDLRYSDNRMSIEYPNRKHLAIDFVSNLEARKNFHSGNYLRMKNRIRKLRKDAGLSQTELGRRVGIGKAAMSKLETGGMELTAYYMQKIADVLGCDLIEIMRELTPVERAAAKIARELNDSGAARWIGFGEGLLEQKESNIKKTETAKSGLSRDDSPKYVIE